MISMNTIHCQLSYLTDLLEGRQYNCDQNNCEQIAVSFYDAVSVSSRPQKSPGNSWIFVAQKGVKADGHDFIEDAFAHGAKLAVVERETAAKNFPAIVVSNTHKALSALAAHFNSNPSEKLVVVGVTGTNGKTTTHWLLQQVLKQLLGPTLRIGTLGNVLDGIINEPGELTTPDPISIQRNLFVAEQSGAEAAVMEASSHALDQARVEHVQFDAAIYSNLTRDHLDYHQDMERYFAAKSHLFELLSESDKPSKVAVINRDDAYGKRLIARLPELGLRDFSYGKDPESTVQITGFDQHLAGSSLKLRYHDKVYTLVTSFIGLHNASNLASTFACAVGLGFDPSQILSALANCPQVPGRLEIVKSKSLGVYVDYAHTPDALENVLSTLAGLTKREIWVVFGCGGDRDKGKRPQMAEVASRLAQRVVVTSDNPRTEDPEKIIEDILSGGVKPEIVNADRRSAIRETLERAQSGDIVLIAGKGHEDYQIIGTTRQHFSDVEEAQKVLATLGRIS